MNQCKKATRLHDNGQGSVCPCFYNTIIKWSSTSDVFYSDVYNHNVTQHTNINLAWRDWRHYQLTNMKQCNVMQTMQSMKTMKQCNRITTWLHDSGHVFVFDLLLVFAREHSFASEPGEEGVRSNGTAQVMIVAFEKYLPVPTRRIGRQSTCGHNVCWNCEKQIRALFTCAEHFKTASTINNEH